MKPQDALKYHCSKGKPIIAVLPMNKENIENLYLFYFNDFLTVERFAEYHGFNTEKAKRIIEIGRKLNHRRPSKYKGGVK